MAIHVGPLRGQGAWGHGWISPNLFIPYRDRLEGGAVTQGSEYATLGLVILSLRDTQPYHRVLSGMMPVPFLWGLGLVILSLRENGSKWTELN